MISHIEQGYNQLPPFIQLPESLRQGLDCLWDKSTGTQTEWVGTIIRSNDGYQVLPLGHQAEGMVTVPITDLLHNAKTTGREIDKDFVRRECAESDWEIRHTPNEQGIHYQGAILYLLPRRILTDQPDLFLPILSAEDMVKPEEEFLGIAHSHSGPDSLNQLPSLTDIRRSVLGLPNPAFETVAHVISLAYIAAN